MWLQTWGPGGGAACKAVALGPQWQSVTHTWTVPAASEASVLRVILNDFNGLSFDVRNVELFESVEGAWRPLEPLLQVGASLNFQTGQNPEPQAGIGFIPNEDWQRFSFDVRAVATSPRASTLSAKLAVGSSQSTWTRLEVRDIVLKAEGATQPTPLATFARVRLWFRHSNLAAHMVLSVALTALALTPSVGPTLLITGIAALTLYWIRSRAAWLALVLGLSWFLQRLAK